jgi:DNA primase
MKSILKKVQPGRKTFRDYNKGISQSQIERAKKDPRGFYKSQGFKLNRINKDYAMELCVFHEDHNPSLSINLRTGSFKCFSCGARGGDIIDFYQQRYGVSFKEALKAIGGAK